MVLSFAVLSMHESTMFCFELHKTVHSAGINDKVQHDLLINTNCKAMPGTINYSTSFVKHFKWLFVLFDLMVWILQWLRKVHFTLSDGKFGK